MTHQNRLGQLLRPVTIFRILMILSGFFGIAVMASLLSRSYSHFVYRFFVAGLFNH